MTAGQIQQHESSYELYKEIAEELCVPVDLKLGAAVRFELYKSKIVYLKNLFEQCFKAVNSPQSGSLFTPTDLQTIHQAIDVTKKFLHDTVIEALSESFERATSKNIQGPLTPIVHSCALAQDSEV